MRGGAPRFSMADAESLIRDVHGRLLRRACQATGTHFEGLGTAARKLFREAIIDSSIKRKLLSIDLAASYLQHISQPLCDQVYEHIDQLLSDNLTMPRESVAKAKVLATKCLAPEKIKVRSSTYSMMKTVEPNLSTVATMISYNRIFSSVVANPEPAVMPLVAVIGLEHTPSIIILLWSLYAASDIRSRVTDYPRAFAASTSKWCGMNSKALMRSSRAIPCAFPRRAASSALKAATQAAR